jgi:hypothetical protein
MAVTPLAAVLSASRPASRMKTAASWLFVPLLFTEGIALNLVKLRLAGRINGNNGAVGRLKRFGTVFSPGGGRASAGSAGSGAPGGAPGGAITSAKVPGNGGAVSFTYCGSTANTGAAGIVGHHKFHGSNTANNKGHRIMRGAAQRRSSRQRSPARAPFYGEGGAF